MSIMSKAQDSDSKERDKYIFIYIIDVFQVFRLMVIFHIYQEQKKKKKHVYNLSQARIIISELPPCSSALCPRRDARDTIRCESSHFGGIRNLMVTCDSTRLFSIWSNNCNRIIAENICGIYKILSIQSRQNLILISFPNNELVITSQIDL